MDSDQPDHISKKRAVYSLPTEGVTVRRGVEYRATDAGPLTLDLYHPPGAAEGAPTPAVLIVAGYPDPGFQARLGCKFKDMGSTVSWAELFAASGLAAITYTNHKPEDDLRALLAHVRQNAASLGIDETKLAIWASSGNVPLALSVLMRDAHEPLKCAALCYGFMLDLDGFTDVAETSKAIGFTNPNAGRSLEDLPQDLPLFITRAGQDQFPHLNETIDRFLAHAVARNLPITFVNHPEGPHAFDLFHDSETTREIIRQILAFLRFHLT